MSEFSPILVLQTSKQKFDMAKVAIKNENIKSFGGIYHIMDVFSKLGFERQGRQGGQATDGYVRSDIHIPLYPYQ
jgi:putative uncharacterized protein (fragment)